MKIKSSKAREDMTEMEKIEHDTIVYGSAFIYRGKALDRKDVVIYYADRTEIDLPQAIQEAMRNDD